MKLLFISLGCDKNLVDSEHMLAMLAKDGFTMTDDEQEAEVIVVNSCCFIRTCSRCCNIWFLGCIRISSSTGSISCSTRFRINYD